jgi:predicted small secreted protein
MRNLSTVVLLLVFASLAACNTVAGAGEDMQVGGHKLENAAEQNK